MITVMENHNDLMYECSDFAARLCTQPGSVFTGGGLAIDEDGKPYLELYVMPGQINNLSLPPVPQNLPIKLIERAPMMLQ